MNQLLMMSLSNKLLFAGTFVLLFQVLCGESSKRIIGGRKVRVGEYPFMVFLDIKTPEDSFDCGGSILDDQWVITAAHCINDQGRFPVKAHVYRAIDNIQAINRTKGYSVQSYFIHCRWNSSGTSDDDIALLRTCEPMDLDNVNVSKIDLPERKEEKNYNEAEILGYGSQERNRSIPLTEENYGSLQVAKIEIFDDTDRLCVKSPRFNASGMICAFDINGMRGFCGGDSGGPLFVRGKTGKPVLLGIVSFTYGGCATPDAPSFFTRVSRYLNWIKDTMKKNNKKRAVCHE